MASIQKRGSSSWLLVVETGYDASGKRIKQTKTIRIDDQALLKTTKRLNDYLKDELAKFKIEVEAGEYIAPEKMLFSAFVDIWSKKFVEKNLEETSQFNYKYHTTKRLIPFFGHLQIEKIKTLHIMDFLDKLSESVGKATVVYNYRVLSSIFTKAKEWKVIKLNPMEGVTKPKEPQTEMKVYDETEVSELLNALQEEQVSFRILITLALTTGMRRGELLGLEWKHIDLDQGIIDIKQTLPMFKDGVPILKGPKRKASIRKIVIPSTIIEELKQYHLFMKKERLKHEEPWRGGDHFFLFARTDGLPMYPKKWGDKWRDFHKRNNLKKYIRFHDLRHTSATLLINQGIHAKIISSRLGHAKITTTMNVYGHVIESADRSAAETFNSLFTSKTKAKQST